MNWLLRKKSGSKFNMKGDEHELLLLGSPDNRVQGLSGNDIVNLRRICYQMRYKVAN
jgi:hypothetical protein